MINLRIKDDIYKCVLDVSAIMEIEQELNTNPVNVFIGCQSGELPKLRDIHTILHYSLSRFNHGLNLNDTKNIMSEYISDKGLNGLIEFISNLFENSGLIKLDEATEKKRENGSTKISAAVLLTDQLKNIKLELLVLGVSIQEFYKLTILDIDCTGQGKLEYFTRF